MKEFIAELKKLGVEYELSEKGVVVGGSLYLRSTQIKELPDNLTVGGLLDLSNTPIQKLPDNLTVGEELDLGNTSIQKLPDNLTVNGSLDLRYTEIKELPENLTVGGWLDLSNTPIQKLPDNLTVGEWLNLSYTQIKELPDNLTVGERLDLRHTPIQKLPDNLTVGGMLDLSHTQIKELPNNLTVGGSIDLSDTQIKELPDNLNNTKNLQNGDYVKGEYLYADNILTPVKKEKKLGNYTLYIGKIPGKNVIFNGKHYVHCNSLREGIADLKFKEAVERGADQYKGLSLDTKLSLEEAKTMYRIITGACRQGTEHFVNSLKEVKEKYTIKECIELTKGQYNADKFADFFISH